MIGEQKTIRNLVFRKQNSIIKSHNFVPSEPLWKRAPTRDNLGKPYADFMMLISGLNNVESVDAEEVIHKLEGVFHQYEKDIIFVDLNFKINILWVTLNPRTGLSSEIAAFIHHVVPQAKLISQHAVSSRR